LLGASHQAPPTRAGGERRDGFFSSLKIGRTVQNISDAGRSRGRCVRRRGALLQYQAPTFDDRLYEPYGVRDGGDHSLSGCQPNRGQFTPVNALPSKPC
jgi:hypothetical protein